MNIIKPDKLKHGDTIAIIAPAGCVDKEKIINSKKYFESRGFKVKLGENLFKKDRYMAGNDNERLSDFHEAFEDKEVRAIFCARGGYGAIRLINKIDYNIIKNDPKIFCGYSDISALSAMILKKTGLITFSSPMAQGDFQPEDLCEYTVNNFWQTISSNNVKIEPKELKIYKNGEAQGILFGGNLATISSLCGLDFIPDVKFIFFAEDLNEPVYKIDRYFRQLLNIEVFRKNLSAIILGDFLDVEYSEQLNTLFTEIAQELQIPVIGRYPISHDREKVTLPIGGKAILNSGILTIEY